MKEAEDILSKLQKSRNSYISEVIEHYNRLQKRLALEKQLKKESYLIREESLSMLKEFEQAGYDDASV